MPALWRTRRQLMTALAAAAAALSLIPLAAGAAAADYPSKPVRVFVPSSPGGASDVAARLLGAKLTEMLGQPFVVENRVAGGGLVGTEQLARAAPDGYSVLVTFDTFASNPYLFSDVHYDPVKDFAPIILVARYPQVLVVHPSLGVRTLAEFVAYAKQHGDRLNYASAGPASSSRLGYELFSHEAGIQATAVHYKGGGPAISDLLAGNVQVMLVQAGALVQQSVKAGKLIALGTSERTRSPLFPGVPAIAELYPGFETTSWVGLLAPAGTPPAVIEKLHDSVAKALATPDLRAKFDGQGAEIAADSPEDFAAFIKSESVKWGKLIRELHISVN
jgi:tripartite-type tricarboxylate transporter receptor subunit TctC